MGKCSFRTGNHARVLLGIRFERIERSSEFTPMLRAPIGMPRKVACAEARVEPQCRGRPEQNAAPRFDPSAT